MALNPPPSDSLIDSFIPAEQFIIPELNYSRLAAIQDLLVYTKCVMRAEADGAVHFFVPDTDGLPWEAATAYAVNDYVRPTAGVTGNETFQCTTAGTSAGSEPTWPTGEGNTVADNSVVWTAREHDYTYEFDVEGAHTIFAKAIQKRLLVPNFVLVTNHPDDEDSFTGSAEDTDSSDLTDMEYREHYYAAVTSDADCVAIAKAILHQSQLRNQTGAGSAPLNCGQEAHDYIKMTDSRQSENSLGNVWTMERVAGQGQWEINLSLGDARQGGFEGLEFAITPVPELVQLMLEADQALDARIEASVTEAMARGATPEEVEQISRRIFAETPPFGAREGELAQISLREVRDRLQTDREEALRRENLRELNR